MTITLTPLTRKQIKSVAKAAAWIAGAYILALVAARIQHYKFNDSIVKLGIPGYINLAIYTASKIFQQEESQAIGALPVSVQAPVADIVAQLPV